MVSANDVDFRKKCAYHTDSARSPLYGAVYTYLGSCGRSMLGSRHTVEFLRPSSVRYVRVIPTASRWLHHSLFHYDLEFRLRQLESIGGEAAWFGVDGGADVSCRCGVVHHALLNSANSWWYVDSPSTVFIEPTSVVAVYPHVDSRVVLSRSRLFRGSASNT